MAPRVRDSVHFAWCGKAETYQRDWHNSLQKPISPEAARTAKGGLDTSWKDIWHRGKGRLVVIRLCRLRGESMILAFFRGGLATRKRRETWENLGLWDIRATTTATTRRMGQQTDQGVSRACGLAFWWGSLISPSVQFGVFC